MSRPFLPKHLKHDNPVYPKLIDEDFFFLEAEAARCDKPLNILARELIHEKIQEIRRERQKNF